MQELITVVAENKMLVAGSIFMLFYSGARFNTWAEKGEVRKFPGPPRYFTTWGRFSLFGGLYILFGVLFYWFLVSSPDLLRLLSAGAALPEGVDEQFLEASAPLWALLILTTLAPNIRWINQLEPWVRRKLQNMASITSEARILAKSMERSFTPDPARVNQVIAELNNLSAPLAAGLSSANFTWTGDTGDAADTDSTRHKLCRASYLISELDRWSGSRRFAGLMSRYPSEFDTFKAIREDIVESYVHLSRLQDLAADTKAGETRKSLDENIATNRKRITTQLDYLLERMYWFICCGILKSERLTGNRESDFAALGFEPPPASTVLIDSDTLVASSAVVFVTILVPTLIYQIFLESSGPIPAALQRIAPTNPGEGFAWSVLGLMVFGLAMTCALVFKRRLFRGTGQKRRSSDLARRPIAQYAVIFTAGYAVGWLLSLIVLLWLDYTDPNVVFVRGLSNTWMWPFLPATTAVFIAIHIDTVHDWVRKDKGPYPALRRVRDGVFQGVSTAVIALLACVLYFKRITLHPVELDFAIFVAITIALTTFGIGVTFFRGYQQALLHKIEERKLLDRGRDPGGVLTIVKVGEAAG